jgi:hypothetical protein
VKASLNPVGRPRTKAGFSSVLSTVHREGQDIVGFCSNLVEQKGRIYGKGRRLLDN